jgi:hypothetical protein
MTVNHADFRMTFLYLFTDLPPYNQHSISSKVLRSMKAVVKDTEAVEMTDDDMVPFFWTGFFLYRCGRGILWSHKKIYAAALARPYG